MGRRFHAALLARFEAEQWRLSVVGANAESAVPFWRALGYVETGERRPWRGECGQDDVAILMERSGSLS